MSNYGLNFNAAFTQNDGQSTFGVHVTDSEGLDLSHEESGANELEVLTKVCNGVSRDMKVIQQARRDKAEKEAAAKAKEKLAADKAKQEKLCALKKQAEELQKEIAAMEEETKVNVNIKPETRKSVFDMSSEIDDIFKTFGAIFKQTDLNFLCII